MGDIPFIKEPSVKTIVKDNGNRTALEQWALLTVIPAMVLSGLYLAVRSQMTADAWWMLFTMLGVIAAGVALWRFGRWHQLVDKNGLRRPREAEIGLNLIVNSWPGLLAIIWQVLVVDVLSVTLSDNWPIVLLFIVCACAIVSTLFFGKRMMRELTDPLAGNSIEIGVRERELRHEERLKELEAKRAQASIEYAQKLEAKVADLAQQLDKAKRGSRVIFSNHGTARGDSTLHIDDNEALNRFVVAAFGGQKRTRDEWAKFLIVDPLTETVTDGRNRYNEFRKVLVQAGLWNMQSGPIKSLEAACRALSIPLPHSVTASAGGRAGVGSALAVPPDFDDRAGGAEDVSDEGEADDE